MKDLEVMIAQINTAVGDIRGNTDRIKFCIDFARGKDVDIICFPEMTIPGYPPEDLLLKSEFIEDNIKAFKSLIKSTNGICAIIGFVDKIKDKIYNSAAVIADGKLLGIHHKMCLPNYGVFDEKRYFTPGDINDVKTYKYRGVNFGVAICEDIWKDEGPTYYEMSLGAELIISLNASPYHIKKFSLREDVISDRALKINMPIIYNNLVGGQDELIFDGRSLVVDCNGKIYNHGKAFDESLSIATFSKDNMLLKNEPYYKEANEIENAYKALVLGVKDYVTKNRFKKAVIGLSGGIDSALTAAIAVDALGSDKVVGVCMPAKYSSIGSRNDATALANNLKIELLHVPIEVIRIDFLNAIHPYFNGTKEGLAEENMQARIRANVLFSLSNKFGYLVLGTGNKSEIAVGYSTLGGDGLCGFSVLKDVYKTMVYKLAKYRNSLSYVIPNNSIIKPPSAELRDNQKDVDSLPEYSILDEILKMYIEEDKGHKEIIKAGFNKKIVDRVIKMVDRNEYKRRQSAPGIKITTKAFGKDRRMPITNVYK